MSSVYVDTSAAAKILVDEPETSALTEWLDHTLGDEVVLVSSLLLETELRRFAQRTAVTQGAVTDLLQLINLTELPPSLFHEAGILPVAGLRSLDALHLASATRIGVAGLVTYDARMAEGARALGIPLHQPQ
jgi:predicted nucleic acid-binding protein